MQKSRFGVHYSLSEARRDLRQVAEVSAGGVTMKLETSEAGLQVYDAGFLSASQLGLEGRAYGPRVGLALEPHAWIDAPNQAWCGQVEMAANTPTLVRSRFVFSI